MMRTIRMNEREEWCGSVVISVCCEECEDDKYGLPICCRPVEKQKCKYYNMREIPRKQQSSSQLRLPSFNSVFIIILFCTVMMMTM
jgi:hypothetical protein